MTQLLTWTVTGLAAGWLVRALLRSGREFGLPGALVTGWLGAMVGGWLFRRVGAVAPAPVIGHVLAALTGALALFGAVRALRALATTARATAPAAGPARPRVAGGLEGRIRDLGQLERRVLAALLSRQPSSADPDTRLAAQTTVGERVADRVAGFGGSWTFIGLFLIAMIAWMTLNEEMARPFDPYPYILLNLVLSCLAALQAPVIMMSQNRQAARDRSDARSDYEVNLRSEMEIAAVHTKLDLLREQEWVRLLGLVEQQQRTLGAIEARLEAMGPARDRETRS